DFDTWRCLSAFDGQLGSALPKMAIAGVQHHGVTPLSRSYATIAGGGGAVASAVPLPNMHFKCPRPAPAQKEGTDFVVVIAPKQQRTKKENL
ncbi:hypothetical protein N320_12445, partial [Buceros rhinoceros silvestris]